MQMNIRENKENKNISYYKGFVIIKKLNGNEIFIEEFDILICAINTFLFKESNNLSHILARDFCVHIVAEVYKNNGVYDPKRIFGVTQWISVLPVVEKVIAEHRQEKNGTIEAHFQITVEEKMAKILLKKLHLIKLKEVVFNSLFNKRKYGINRFFAY